jgi:hypothetical protein
MQLRYPRAQAPNPVALLRQAGYAPFRDPQSHEESWVIRLGPDFYPRLHLYVEETPDQITLSFHLDQKKPSYGHSHQHNGEYDGPLLEKERTRLLSWIKALNSEI